MYVQIVNFRLKQGVSRKGFLALTEKMLVWLKSRDGFVAYELYEGAESWSDRISWDSEQHAKVALNAFRSTAIAMQLVPLIKSDFSCFFGEAVVSS
jgi:hypothetical protein